MVLIINHCSLIIKKGQRYKIKLKHLLLFSRV